MNISKFSDYCCGCGECFAICPVQAISMKKNHQGFYYPEIDEKKCIGCSKCVKRCSFNKSLNDDKANFTPIAYAVKHKNENIRMDSRSGGIFTAVSDYVLEQGGVVYGCKLENCDEAIHIRVTSKVERDAFRGSKYIQSIVCYTFEQVKQDLKNGLWVLYSGTPCQINAIKDYCKDLDCSKLVLIDIVCHGVPSQKVWKDYLKYLERRYRSKAVSVDFRDKKKFGWADHQETIIFKNRKEHSDNLFTKLFYSHLIIRKECFECPYKNLNRVGDITIADCWGISREYPDFDDNKGVSLVLLNSQKGMEIFNRGENIDYIEVEIGKLLQPPLRENWEMPREYKEFWEFYQKHSFAKVRDKYIYGDIRFYQKVVGRLKKILRNFLER